MRTSLFFSVVLVLVLACARADETPAATAEPSVTPSAIALCPRAGAAVDGATTKVLVPIEGMTCAACAGHIKEALGKVAGVKGTKVRLAERDVLVDVVRPSVTDECLVATIHSVGDYKAGAPKVFTP